MNISEFLQKKSSSCPPPASLTATLQTTVSPHSWLITKQRAVSARAVNWMFNILDCSTCEMDGLYVERGLCSDRTKELLRDQETCVIPMWSQKYNIYYTTVELIRSMCENQTLQDFRPAPLERRSEKRQSKSREPLQRSHSCESNSSIYCHL